MSTTDDSKAKRQRILLIVAVVLLVVAGVFGARSMTSKSAEKLAAERVYKCAEAACGHEFEHTIQMGEIDPINCPKCGKSSAYKAEACFWTKDAAGNWKAKANPTFVVLKSRIDPNSTEKTYCPDCGRVVVGHNPRPPKELMDAAKKEAGK